MDLLKLLINTNKLADPCCLCFKNDKNNLNIHTVFEIRNKCDIITMSLADMLKKILPSEDFTFMWTCDDCSNLISKLYILLHNRKSKIFLLNYLVKQLVKETDIIKSTPVDGDKLVLKVQIPTYKEIIRTDVITNDVHEIHYNNMTNYLSEDICHIYDKTCDDTLLNQDKNIKVEKRCQYCPAIVQGSEELRSHLRIHRKKQQKRHTHYYCNDCNYKTLSKPTLQAHINKNHLLTRPHICEICFKGFYNRSNLNEHVKTHNNERSQICELCGCSFLHKKSLIEHLRLHSDTRPYECHICHKNFVTSGRRSDHIKRSHMEKTECCMICNKKYSLRKELTRHMNNVHLRSM